MSCLDATFTLTPRSPRYYNSSSQLVSYLLCYGADFFSGSPQDFPSLYTADSLYFDSFTAADPSVDYSHFLNRIRVPFLEFYADLTAYGPAKQLALIFGFEAPFGARVLVYSDAGLVSDQTLSGGDNQFLLEIESLDSGLVLYFIHAGFAHDATGGPWFFNGLSGYVV